MFQNHQVNVRDYSGWLPIHEAANHGFVEIVDYLIDKGAWINDRGGDECEGITPLHDAAANGRIDVVRLLVQRGVNVHAKNDYVSAVFFFFFFFFFCWTHSHVLFSSSGCVSRSTPRNAVRQEVGYV